MTLSVRLLGLPTLSIDEVELNLRGHKPLALLAYLINTHKTHSRQHLVDLLFDKAADPRGSLRWILCQLRKHVGDEYLLADRYQVAFDFDSDYWCDLEVLQTGTTSVYRGAFLEGLELRDGRRFMNWLYFEREHWRDVYQQGLVSQLERNEQGNDHKDALDIAQTLIQLDNLREAWHRAAMRAYARLGKREAALAQYELCRQILGDELGMSPSARTQALAETIRAGQHPNGGIPPHQRVRAPTLAITQPPATDLPPPSNLPMPTSSFVGRKAEMRVIAERMANPHCRLLTLLGPGGIGKSRLALQTAAKLRSSFEHGVFLVPLAQIDSADSFLPALASHLDLPVRGLKPPLTQLQDYLRERSLLLLLDNFEHLLNDEGWPAAAEFLSDLLLIAPAVKILVTSRQRLNLQEEWLLDLQGLCYPTNASLSRADLLNSGAVQLFLQRAAQLQASYEPATVTTDELTAVACICHLVQGMPLAIELAAAWARQLSCAEIKQAITADMGFLASPSSTAPDRHASLRATFEHSWRLLRRDERELLRQLAVFQGHFDRAAAAEIAGASFFSLSHLIDKSLLQNLPPSRYQMHALIRQFALEKLGAKGDLETATRDRHSAFYCDFLAQRENDLKGKRQVEAAAEIENDFGNATAAWEWAGRQAHYRQLASAAFSLGHFLSERGRVQEGRMLFAGAASRLGKGDGGSQSALALARIAYWQSRFAQKSQVKDLLDASSAYLDAGALTAEETHLDQAAAAQALGDYLQEVRGDSEAGKRSYLQSLRLAEDAEAKWEQARALTALSELLIWMEGDYLGARRLAERSLALRREINDLAGMVDSLASLTIITSFLRQYREAFAYAQEGLNLSRPLGAIKTEQSRDALAWVYLLTGQIDRTVECLHKSLRICIDLGDRTWLMDICKALAYRNALGGNYEAARFYARHTLDLPSQTVEHEQMKHAASISLSHIAFHERDYTAAKHLAQKAADYLQPRGSHNLVTLAQTALCAANMALGNFHDAEQQAYTLLRDGVKQGGATMLTALNLVAILMGRHACTESEKERVFELIGMQRHHFPLTDTPAYHEWSERLLPPSLAALEPARIEAALSRGVSLDPHSVIRQLFSEVTRLGWGQHLQPAL
ncbi:MAG: AAA family ATPase [Chloroflexi bacterium]|nr:AAA family ATPase [Chloroflexota bacterium]